MVVHWWPNASSAQRPRISAHLSLLPMLLNFNSLSATQINVIKLLVLTTFIRHNTDPQTLFSGDSVI